MCMFCAAIPVAAATGASLQSKQTAARLKSEAAGEAPPPARPVVQVTAGVIVLLVLGSAAYHTLTYLP